VHDITLGQLLRDVAAEVPDRIAVVEGDPVRKPGRRWTYAELLDASEQVARALLQRFRPGERIAVYAPNCAEWMLLQHGASLAGLLLVPLNPAYKRRETEVILRSCRAAGIFYTECYRDNDTAAIVADLQAEIDQLREAHPLAEIQSFASESGATLLPDIAAGDVLQVQFTSGTTGIPKGALLHHKGLINTTRFVADRAEFPDGGVWINAMPMFHIAGSAVARIGCLSKRGTFVLASGFDAGLMLELIETERGNATLIVPTMILAMLDHEDFHSRDLSSLMTVLSGAAHVPAALVERTKAEIGCKFTILYGQTESNGNIATTRRSDSVEDQVTTVGTPLPQVEVKIASPHDGAVLPLGQDGEICARGYQVMAGYDYLPEETGAAIDEEGWLHTGDLGTLDARGYLRITGRLKDMIIRGGMNLYPREIEDVIFAHPEVSQVSVVGVPDERWGEIVVAVVIPRDPAAAPDPAELTAYCRSHLARHKVPVQWFMVERFPLTPSGKIQKFILRDQILSATIAPSATPA
jgi:acyl-CoA synthetase (AMP-forming)/AMP-acid ligase II